MSNKNSITDLIRQTAIDAADVPLILDFITEANEHIGYSEAALLELEKNPGHTEMIDRIFRAFHTIKGITGFLNLTDIGALAHSAENLLDLARKGTLAMCSEKIDLIFNAIDAMKNMTAALKAAVESGEELPSFPQLQLLLDSLQSAATEKTSPLSKIDQGKNYSDDITAASILSELDENIKVKIDHLDSLVNAVGELTIAQLMVAEEIGKTKNASQRLLKDVVRQSKLISELQEISMSMRMVPLDGVFQKMTRLVRDLSAKTNKDIKFVTTGGHTEIDRRIVEKIADPLVHMIRNCIDHGIETKQQREEAGKDPTAKIELRAFGRSGKIFIEIEDDGRGLDKTMILQKAIEKGIVAPDAKQSDAEIYKLIFAAGLTTAHEVTDVSGRGVGMDIVKKNIEALRGKIDIATQADKGTTFTIALPLTLATIQGQIVRVGSHRYILPIASIVRSFKPTASQLFTVSGSGQMVMVDNELMPIVPLQKLFNKTSATDNLTKSLLVIVEDDMKKCAVLIDELLGKQEVVIKSLGHNLSSVPGIYGGAILGDGKVTLILDIPGLIKLSQC